MKKIVPVVIIAGALLAGCATPAPAPTATPTEGAVAPAATAVPPTKVRTAMPTSTSINEPTIGPAPTSTPTATPAAYDFRNLGLPFHEQDVKIFKYGYRPIGDPCGFHAGDMIYVGTTFEANPAPRHYEVLAPADGEIVYATYIGASAGWEVRILIGQEAQGPIFATMVHLDEFHKQVGDHVERGELIGANSVWKDSGRKELVIDFSLRHHPTGLGPGSYDDPSGYLDPAPYLIDDLPPAVMFENEGPGYCQ